jgi:hypothetical protein
MWKGVMATDGKSLPPFTLLIDFFLLFFETESHFVAEAVLEHEILLPSLLKYWNYMVCVLSHPALVDHFFWLYWA